MNKHAVKLAIFFAISYSSNASATFFEPPSITTLLIPIIYLMSFVAGIILFIKFGLFVSRLEIFNEPSQSTSSTVETQKIDQPVKIENVAVSIRDVKRKVIID